MLYGHLPEFGNKLKAVIRPSPVTMSGFCDMSDHGRGFNCIWLCPRMSGNTWEKVYFISTISVPIETISNVPCYIPAREAYRV